MSSQKILMRMQRRCHLLIIRSKKQNKNNLQTHHHVCVPPSQLLCMCHLFWRYIHNTRRLLRGRLRSSDSKCDKTCQQQTREKSHSCLAQRTTSSATAGITSHFRRVKTKARQASPENKLYQLLLDLKPSHTFPFRTLICPLRPMSTPWLTG